MLTPITPVPIQPIRVLPGTTSETDIVTASLSKKRRGEERHEREGEEIDTQQHLASVWLQEEQEERREGEQRKRELGPGAGCTNGTEYRQGPESDGHNKPHVDDKEMFGTAVQASADVRSHRAFDLADVTRQAVKMSGYVLGREEGGPGAD